jgi:hypothetical protein
MRPHRYALISTDDTLHVTCDEVTPLVTEATRLVEEGQYAIGELGLFTMTHELFMPRKLQLVPKLIKEGK